ncbi:MAG TPA: sigma-70 family RNA polymerase sigma factor [Sphingobacteriaceae bacterium]
MGAGKNLDKEWSGFIKDGSQAAFYDVYKHYYHYLTYIGLKRKFETGRVKDCINDSFLSIWEGRHNLGHIQNHHNYIITIFLRKLYRKEKLDLNTEVESLPDLELSPSVEEQFIDREEKLNSNKRILNHLHTLPSRQREMIYQKFFLNLSYQEIAEANGVSINTVYNTIYKSLDKLRFIVKKDLFTFFLSVSFIFLLFLIFSQNQ